MAPDLVRYSDDIETFDPDLDELLPQVIEFWERKAQESPEAEGTGKAVRPAHAKSIGFVRAEVQILENVPAEYAQGIYASPGRHDALIRFSNVSGHLAPDGQLGPGQGFAIKIFDVEGETLVEDEPDAGTFDLVLKNTPFFIANTAKHYLFIQSIVHDVASYVARGKEGFRELLTELLTGKGTLEQKDWAWEELLAFVKTATETPVTNPLLTTFWSMAAVRHGDYVAKVRVAPVAESAEQVIHRELDLEIAPDVFRSTVVDELQAGAFDFDLQIQLCADLEKMPVNDVTVEWPEKLAPFVTVGRVHIPRQDISRQENLDRGDCLAFNQWRVTHEHRPLGEIMKVRQIYSQSAKIRRALNHQAQVEPSSAAEVLPNGRD